MWFWRPQVALFGNETTLVPVLVPVAPEASVVGRFRADLRDLLGAGGFDSSFVAAEQAEIAEHRLAKTANRSVLGIMNEFAYLADTYRNSVVCPDLKALAARLADTPCSPLYKRHITPEAELAAVAQKRYC